MLWKVIRKTKAVYYNEMLTSSTNKSKMFWNIINSETGTASNKKFTSSCSCRVRCIPCSLILKMELVPPSLLRPFGLYHSACPSSVHVVATFPGIVLFPLLYSVLRVFP